MRRTALILCLLLASCGDPPDCRTRGCPAGTVCEPDRDEGGTVRYVCVKDISQQGTDG